MEGGEKSLVPGRLQTLEVWQQGMALVKDVYTLSRGWPKEELYGLTGQARRAAVSVPTNLAEGLGRGTPGEIVRFAQIALGSTYELHTLLNLALELGFSTEPEVGPLLTELNSLTKRISSFIRHHEKQRP